MSRELDVVALSVDYEGIEGVLESLDPIFRQQSRSKARDRDSVLDYTQGFVQLARSGADLTPMIDGLVDRNMTPAVYTVCEVYSRSSRIDKGSILDSPKEAIQFARNHERYFAFIDGIVQRGMQFSDSQRATMITHARDIAIMIKKQKEIFSFLDLMKEYGIKPDSSYRGFFSPNVAVPLAEYTGRLREFFTEFSQYGEINPPNLASEKGLRDVKSFDGHLDNLVSLAKLFKENDIRLDLKDVGENPSLIKTMCKDVNDLRSYFELANKDTDPKKTRVDYSNLYHGYVHDGGVRNSVKNLQFTRMVVDGLRAAGIKFDLENALGNTELGKIVMDISKKTARARVRLVQDLVEGMNRHSYTIASDHNLSVAYRHSRAA